MILLFILSKMFRASENSVYYDLYTHNISLYTYGKRCLNLQSLIPFLIDINNLWVGFHELN